MVMSSVAAVGDASTAARLPSLWRAIEDAHYSYLETDDSPEKLQQRKKLEGYITEYLSLVPHECKFGLSETGKVFQRTIDELSDFSAYRAGLGWAALARYAANLLAQPWRNEYKTIRLYCGFYKHEVESNMVGAETLLQAMGYKAIGHGKLVLDAPVCPDMVAAISRDALIAHAECQIMCQIWEAVWSSGGRTTWAEVGRERYRRAGTAAAGAARLANCRSYPDGSEIYSNVPATESSHQNRLVDPRLNNSAHCTHSCLNEAPEDPIIPTLHPPYLVPTPSVLPPLYPMGDLSMPQCPVPMMTPYGAVPYYYPVQAPYMIPTPMFAPIKQATTVPVNGYPPQYRYPAVPTAQLIELDSPSVYENGKYDRHREDRHKRSRNSQLEASRRNSTSKSGFSDISLPSLPRSDTQPALSKAREDGMGTYESWDYVFRNLSSKEQERDGKSRYSPSLDRDSRTLDRLDRDDRRLKYQQTTLDLEDGLQALHIDRSYDEDMYRTAKVNENLMKLKQEQELKRARQIAKKQTNDKAKRLEPIPNPKSDGLVNNKIAQDKMRLLTKKDVKDRKEVIKQQNSVNGSATSAEVRKVKKPAKLEVERRTKPVENGIHSNDHSSRNSATASSSQPQPTSYDVKTHLIVTLDETDSRRLSPKPSQSNGDSHSLRSSSHSHQNSEVTSCGDRSEKWECGTCTYINGPALSACEMCGKSRNMGPEIQPLTSGGRECPACTLVNRRDAKACEACGTGLQHCPTYI